MKKPNIVLIMCDQMRGDCMGVAGHPDVQTPYLDSLAAEGTYFPNAYASCPSCIPSRAALFTGMSQERHGRVGYQDGIDWDYPNMLPKVLSDHGYHTEAVGKLHVHPPLRRCGFHNLTLHDGYIGFYRKAGIPARQHQLRNDSYLGWLKDRHGNDADVNDTGLECNSFIASPWVYDAMSHPTNWTVTESIRFLEKRDPDLPFFLMTSFVRPHPPLDAPSEYFDLYRSRELTPPAMGDWEDFSGKAKDYEGLYDSPYGTKNDAVKKDAMTGYYACITHMDHQIGRLLQALYQQEVLEDSILIFLSDHGELLFDHGLFRKVQPYQGSIRIPMIIRVGKNLIPDKTQVRVCDDLVELRDVMPTILDALNLALPDGADGQSFFSSLFGENGFNREYLHGEHSWGELSNQFIVTASDKYIWYSQTGQEHYFRLDQDPKELHDLIRDPGSQERIACLRDHLIEVLKGREEGYSDGISLIPGKEPVSQLKNISDKQEQL
ncbi:MAG: arylsulfatase [Lacrimispora sp.]|uniref:arylsulfatase n=1 Tax=Lacrimispora sp. TaxID=2719234 RepID=UPI0039E6BB16